jgi:hypothetical protein
MDIGALGQQFGLTPEQTRAVMEQLGPVIAAGMRRNADQGSAGGLGDILGGMLGSGGQVDPTSAGNDILGQIFGSKEVSRGVANEVSAQTGVGAAVIKKLLPILASVILAQLASGKGGAGGGGLGDILGSVLGGGQQQGGGGLGDILGSVLGSTAGGGQSQGGGLGDILGQVLGGAGGGRQQQGTGLEDILGQVLGGGQQSYGQGSPADALLEQLQKQLGR